eukprot:scaffold8581_cov78-Skeletonema_menzelii.AAC.1
MQERWTKPELPRPRHEQFLTSGMPVASGPSPRQSQQHDEDDDALISGHSAEGIVIINLGLA